MPDDPGKLKHIEHLRQPGDCLVPGIVKSQILYAGLRPRLAKQRVKVGQANSGDRIGWGGREC